MSPNENVRNLLERFPDDPTIIVHRDQDGVPRAFTCGAHIELVKALERALTLIEGQIEATHALNRRLGEVADKLTKLPCDGHKLQLRIQWAGLVALALLVIARIAGKI